MKVNTFIPQVKGIKYKAVDRATTYHPIDKCK